MKIAIKIICPFDTHEYEFYEMCPMKKISWEGELLSSIKYVLWRKLPAPIIYSATECIIRLEKGEAKGRKVKMREKEQFFKWMNHESFPCWVWVWKFNLKLMRKLKWSWVNLKHLINETHLMNWTGYTFDVKAVIFVLFSFVCSVNVTFFAQTFSQKGKGEIESYKLRVGWGDKNNKCKGHWFFRFESN